MEIAPGSEILKTMLPVLLMTTRSDGGHDPFAAVTAQKVSVVNRVLAKLIDIALVMLIAALLPYPVGPLLGFLYSLTADGLHFWKFDGQSVGKRILGLKVVSITRQQPATLRDSILRNAPVGVATFFAIIPVWGWLILGLIGLPLMAMEIYLMITVETGHRLGDVMGDTQVVEAPSSRGPGRVQDKNS